MFMLEMKRAQNTLKYIHCIQYCRTKVKTDARGAAKLMREAKKPDGSAFFEVEHLLNCKQIAGVYKGFKTTKLDKRDKVNKKDDVHTTRASRLKRSEEEEEEEPDEVNALFDTEGDPDLEYKSEPLFDETENLHFAIKKKEEKSEENEKIFEGKEEYKEEKPKDVATQDREQTHHIGDELFK